MRALRIELRRSVAFGALCLLIALGLLDRVWGGLVNSAGGWATVSYSERTALLVMWPLAVGAGAWQARREQNAGVEELLATSSLIGSTPAAGLHRLGDQCRPGLPGRAADRHGADLAISGRGLPDSWWCRCRWGRRALAGHRRLARALLRTVGPLRVHRPTGHRAGDRPARPPRRARPVGLRPPVQPDAATLETPPGDHYELPLKLSGQQGLWLAALAATAFAVTVTTSRTRKALSLLPTLAAAAATLPFLQWVAAPTAPLLPALSMRRTHRR